MTVIDDLAARLGERARLDEPIGPMTTYRVGGRAALFVMARSESDLRSVAQARADSGHSLPIVVIGKGSNLLVSDRGFPGVALALGDEFATIEVGAGERVTAGGAAALPVVARRTAAAGLVGFEWAVGVPGSIGGAVRMNAGGHGSAMAEVLVSARVFDLDGEASTAADLPADRLGFAYRRSVITASDVVVDATVQLHSGDREAAEATIGEIVRWRREHQPGGQNAGSVFTNPPDDSAGRLIDACGLKGHRVGSAQVSTKHANFFQADPDGSADDVVALLADVQRRVADATGVSLRPEVHLIGFPGAQDGGTTT